jgi:hypothetical protein
MYGRKTVTYSSSLPRQYFEWLYDQVISTRSGELGFTYLVVCEIMHDMIFKIIVPRDANRAADGAQLRTEFMQTLRVEPRDASDLMFPDPSIFEVLVALALKAEMLIDIPPQAMFMTFLENLKLDTLYDESRIVGIRNSAFSKLRKFNDRRYSTRGIGGIFPLSRTTIDQRNQELWYQMGAYMTENQMY